MLRVVKFETVYPANRDPYDRVLVAPIGPAYTRTQTWHNIKNIDPEKWPVNERDGDSYEAAVARWRVIGPAYEAWKSDNEIPTTGTPLEAWSAVTPAQVAVLKQNDVRTVEDVRDMGDNTIGALRFQNARQLPKLAADFLDSKDSVEKDAKIAHLEEQMAAMVEMLEEKKQATAEAPKKRGRPRKTESEAA